ncbi:MAG: exonuclease domain-containing protein [Candidatus Peregrinibacteria bacterium]|nr:exonuclease domain-containing protein [Candidatus Peregrinibacteria bacterium]
MHLPDLPFVVLDTETTGFVPRAHHVIEFASVRFEGGKQVDEYEQLFHAEDIPSHVQAITRIRPAHLSGKPKFEEKREEILTRIGPDTLIVGQNTPFDLSMLKGEGIDLTDRPWVDTSMLASLVFPELKSYSLGYVSTVLHLMHEPQHRALGDVRATLELLSKCWERLLEVTPAMAEQAKEIMEKASPGYRMLFAALPHTRAKSAPKWLSGSRHTQSTAPSFREFEPLAASVPAKGNVQLIEEEPDSQAIEQTIAALLKDDSKHHWVAVRNAETFFRRSVAKGEDEAIRFLHAPQSLPDPEAVSRLLAQETFTADEATLAVKLLWYNPVVRSDVPVHGGEEAVWNGKIACTETSKRFREQLKDLPRVLILDHRQLFPFLADVPGTPEGPVDETFTEVEDQLHMVIGDATYLEDAATRAYGWECPIDDLRAAAEGDALLTKFTDHLQLFIEKTRSSQDLRYLTPSDLQGPEAKGLRKQIAEVRAAEQAGKADALLVAVDSILDPVNLQDRLVWIELRKNGSQFLHSVPEHVSTLLERTLYTRFPTTMIIPRGASDTLAEILPPSHRITSLAAPVKKDSVLSLAITPNVTLDHLLTTPLPGKTLILVPSKGTIEDVYVKYVESLEAKGVTLICQGVSGGHGRMQAQFLAAPAPVEWLVTPWALEAMDLPEGCIDHFVIYALPFDHPSHPVISRRAARYKDAFAQYLLPRLEHRLFRLVRAFCRSRAAGGDVHVLDDRLQTRSYGQRISAYLHSLASEKIFTAVPLQKKVKSTPKGKPKKEESTAQQKLF